jgi:hypothetical protein
MQLEHARVVRTEEGLKRLVGSIELATDGARVFIQSNLVGIPKPKKVSLLADLHYHIRLKAHITQTGCAAGPLTDPCTPVSCPDRRF